MNVGLLDVIFSTFFGIEVGGLNMSRIFSNELRFRELCGERTNREFSKVLRKVVTVGPHAMVCVGSLEITFKRTVNESLRRSD